MLPEPDDERRKRIQLVFVFLAVGLWAIISMKLWWYVYTGSI